MKPSGPYISIMFPNDFRANTFADQKARRATTGLVTVNGNEVRIYEYDLTDKEIISKMAGSENAKVNIMKEENDIERIVESVLRG